MTHQSGNELNRGANWITSSTALDCDVVVESASRRNHNALHCTACPDVI